MVSIRFMTTDYINVIGRWDSTGKHWDIWIEPIRWPTVKCLPSKRVISRNGDGCYPFSRELVVIHVDALAVSNNRSKFVLGACHCFTAGNDVRKSDGTEGIGIRAVERLRDLSGD